MQRISWGAASILVLLLIRADAGENFIIPPSPQGNLAVFEVADIPLQFVNAAAVLNTFSDTQIHDAYDGDRDGVYVRVDATFSNSNGETRRVPAFAMREKANGPWRWHVRWSPLTAGKWTMRIDVDARAPNTTAPIKFSEEFKGFAVSEIRSGIDGPLVIPGVNDDPRFLRRLKFDGKSEALWLFGACRAWVADNRYIKGVWAPDDWIDRDKELFPLLRADGYNLLNQWMAPWEFELVHCDRAEHWQNADLSWSRVALPETVTWSAPQCFDQGRAAAFDALVKSSEGIANPNAPALSTIYLLLTPLAHQALEMKEHPWGRSESCWSTANHGGDAKPPERLNGFSAFKPEMHVWEFFEADPTRPLDDWRSKLFDQQANFYRYVIARWGASRAIGMWVIIDEIDGIGDAVGSMKDKTGWWGHPQCDLWMANIFRLFRGELKRSDGLQYAGDAYHHPLHAATTSVEGQAERGANLDWAGQEGAKPDVFGWHWYPTWKTDANWGEVFAYTTSGIGNYAHAPLGNGPRLISEFGAPDRNAPTDPPSALYPTLYHVAIWSAIFSGHAGTPMDWDDGKEFGELRWRNRPSIFDQTHYPIDNGAELVALRKFLKDIKPDELESKRITCESERPGVQIFSLHSKNTPDRVCGWIFSTLREGPFSISGLSAGTYTITWFDPWTGDPIQNLPAQEFVAENGIAVKLDALPAFKLLRTGLKAFPSQSRYSKGHDAAFKIERK